MKTILLNQLSPQVSPEIFPPTAFAGIKILVLPWLFPKKIISDAETWEKFQGPSSPYYQQILVVLESFGASEDQVTWLNYFAATTAEIKQAVQEADLILLPEGFPEEGFERLQEKNLIQPLKRFAKTVVGIGGGAQLWLSQFHLTPDEHYQRLAFHAGIGRVKGFDLQLDYQKNLVQQIAIARTIKDHRQPVYALSQTGALVLSPEIKTYGPVKLFKRS